MDDYKWLIIGFIFLMALPLTGAALSDYHKANVTIACYEAGKLDCEKLYK